MSDLENSPATGKIGNIQWLRGIAALLVVVSHSIGDMSKLYHTSFIDHIPGTFGVELFFIISGFIITRTSLNRFEQPGAAKTFMWHRVWRIVPLYWACTALYIAMGLVIPAAENRDSFSIPHVVLSFLFWPIIGPRGTFSPVYSLGWSLNFEMFFYLIFAALLWMRPRIAMIIITVMFVGLAALHPLLGNSSPLSFWSRGYIVEFVVGMWLAVAAVKVRWRAPYWTFWPVAILGLVAAGLYFHMHPVSEEGYYLTYVSFIIALLMGLAGVFIGSPTKVGRMGQILTLIGDASFSLYLTHMFTIRIGSNILKALKIPDRVPHEIVWFLLVCATVGVAYLSYRQLELRFIAFGKNIRDKRRRRPIVAPAT